jgi:agmatinase
MTDLSSFDPNGVSNSNMNIFGLPFGEEDARVIIQPVPWEVTVSYSAGTARAADHIMKASRQVDLFDADYREAWRDGFFMRETDKKILLKSDYLRKEAELYIDYISHGDQPEENKFMCKSLREINEGAVFLNNWVYQQTKTLLDENKLVVLLGGDHSTPMGYLKALAEKHGTFGILQIDAHADLRAAYENFTYSHASIMYNVLQEIPQVERLVQIGIRDYCEEEWDYICNSNYRVICFLEKHLREKLYEGITWKAIADEVVSKLPEKVYLSFDVDGLDPKLCPNTGTPVPGGFDCEQVLYLVKRVLDSGRTLIGLDLVETGVGENDWDANVSARLLFRLCGMLVASNPSAKS